MFSTSSQGAHQKTSRRRRRTNSGLSWADCVRAWLTCLSDAAAQEAGLASFLLQLCLHRTQLGKLGTGLALEDMLPCLHMHKPAYSTRLHMATQSDGYVQHPCHCQWRTSFHYRGMCWSSCAYSQLNLPKCLPAVCMADGQNSTGVHLFFKLVGEAWQTLA